MDEGTSSPRTFSVGSQLTLAQLLERKEPEPLAVETSMQAYRDRLRTAKRGAMIDTWIQRRREELEQDGSLLVDSTAVTGG